MDFFVDNINVAAWPMKPSKTKLQNTTSIPYGFNCVYYVNIAFLWPGYGTPDGESGNKDSLQRKW